MFRKLRLWSSLLVGLLLLTPAVAEAHVLKQDNGIAAVMHIEPNDNPLAGQNTKLEFAFGDNRDAFSLANCACGVQLVSAGKTIQRVNLQSAQAGSTLAAITTVRFPETGSYRVVLSGRAINGSFPNFTMTYQVEVAAQAQNTASKKTAAIIEVATLALATLVVGAVLAKSRRKR